jgi:DNA-binding NarL/FixJ family response regulator
MTERLRQSNNVERNRAAESVGSVALRLVLSELEGKSPEEVMEYLKNEYKLTDKESRVFKLLGKGLTNAQISLASGIKFNTVRSSLSQAYGKLGTESREEALSISKALLNPELQARESPAQPSGRRARSKSGEIKAFRIA